MLWAHYFLGKSYRVFIQAMKMVHECTDNYNAVKFCDEKELRSYRDSLVVGKLIKWRNPFGKDIARVWNLVDMVEKVFTNANIVARMKFQFGTIDDKPILLIVLHIDGAQQTSFGHVLCVKISTIDESGAHRSQPISFADYRIG